MDFQLEALAILAADLKSKNRSAYNRLLSKLGGKQKKKGALIIRLTGCRVSHFDNKEERRACLADARDADRGFDINVTMIIQIALAVIRAIGGAM